MVYGLIDFGSYSDLCPRLIVGPSREDVDRGAARFILDYFEENNFVDDDVAEFLAEWPWPDMDDPESVTAWFEGLWAVTTSPSYSRMEDDDVIVVGSYEPCEVCGCETSPDAADDVRCSMVPGRRN
jgi:hypothetical protein